MADRFVAEVRIFPFTFAPTGWAFCDGQLLPISQNTALFSLLGTTYGGNGQSTFALPNLQGSAPMHPGQGPGLSVRDLGEQTGSETVTLLPSEIPAHSHTVSGSSRPASTNNAEGQYWARVANFYTPPVGGQVPMSPLALAPSGGDIPHSNMQPYLTLSFCIALQGIFPPRP